MQIFWFATFLHFSVFWDLYCASPEKRDSCEHSTEAKAFHDYVSCLLFVFCYLSSWLHSTTSDVKHRATFDLIFPWNYLHPQFILLISRFTSICRACIASEDQFAKQKTSLRSRRPVCKATPRTILLWLNDFEDCIIVSIPFLRTRLLALGFIYCFSEFNVRYILHKSNASRWNGPARIASQLLSCT